MSDVLDSDIKFIPGIGPKRGEILFKELNIKTFKDLLYNFPFRYIDRTKIHAIAEVEPAMAYIQLRGKIIRIQLLGEKSPAKRLVATLRDPSGVIDLVFFQGIKWHKERLKLNHEYIIFGRPSVFNQTLNIVHPEIEGVNEDSSPLSGTMMGVYRGTEKLRNNGIGNRQITKYVSSLISSALPHIKESLPQYVLEQKGLMPLKEALRTIHFPSGLKELAAAQFRLKFEELFYLQLSLLKHKMVRDRGSIGIKMPRVGEFFNRGFSNIPFELTDAQKRVIKEIRSDMTSGRQMNRLLQGDVGSGKTMVAILTALIAADNGYQSCIMAPTEVLAGQHYRGVQKILADTGINTALLTGSTKAAERRRIHEGLLNGTIHIIFGTHALIEDSVQFLNLGFAVIDEQHRFGVEQRAKLWTKSEIMPHILVMTATPIPRTLAMTLFGDLDVSVIDQLPPGRKPIITMHTTESRRSRVYAFMKEEIKKGRQIFIVFPLIKESEKMDYKNLQDGYMALTEIFPSPDYVLAVVHGKQKNEDKAHDMELFASGRAHILVSTSVIEVGVDVPNASVMMIESAERFGLSQLHQLRGRVGRGSEKSYCILMTGYKLSKESKQRVELMCSTQDGFELAEADMRMRGPGDIEGTQQSGLAVDLHIADLSKDGNILEDARRYAGYILEKDPLLESEMNRALVVSLNALKKEIKDYSKIS